MVENLITLTLQSKITNQWVVKLRIPESGLHKRVIILFHGWTGDENSMWVFAPRLPEDALLIAVRGLFRSSFGGYGWHPDEIGKRPHVDDLRSTIDAMLDLFNPEIYPDGFFQVGDLDKVAMIGFSQGASLVYTFSLLYPGRISRIAGLSGFLPRGSGSLASNKQLIGKSVFVAHGTQDKVVPVELARKAVVLLQSAGAQVTYCEDDVGHKLSADCFRGLEKFFCR